MHPIPRHINYNSNNVFKSIRKTVRSASHTNCRRIFDGSLHLVQHTEGNQSLNANNVYRCGSCHLCIIIILFFPIPCANDFSDHHHFEHTTFSFLHSIVISIWNNCHLVAIQSIKSECMITLYASLYAFLFISFACHRPQSIDFDRNITIRVWCRPKRMLLLCQSVQVRLQC